MKSAVLAKIEFDESKRLRLYPATRTYEFIYRAACGVHWEPTGRYLWTELPPGLSPADEFKQILSVVYSEYGDKLRIGKETNWKDVPHPTRLAIESLETSRNEN